MMKANTDRMRQRRKGMGMCVDCGVTPPALERQRCQTCLTKRNLSTKRWYEQDVDHARASLTQRRRVIRLEVLAHYGGVCVCCGENTEAFLTLDHVNDDGAAHKRELKCHGGTAMYHYAKRAGYPPTLQLLCWNCNAAKHYYKQCPHQVARASEPHA